MRFLKFVMKYHIQQHHEYTCVQGQMDKMKLELEITKNNMNSVSGNFDNLVKAMGILIII